MSTKPVKREQNRDKLDVLTGICLRIYNEIVGYPTVHAARGKRFAVPIYSSIADAFGAGGATPREVEPLPTDIACLPGRIAGLYIADRWLSPLLDPDDVLVAWYPPSGLTAQHRRDGQLAVITDTMHCDHAGIARWNNGDVSLSNLQSGKKHIAGDSMLYAGIIVGVMRRSLLNAEVDNALPDSIVPTVDEL